MPNQKKLRHLLTLWENLKHSYIEFRKAAQVYMADIDDRQDAWNDVHKAGVELNKLVTTKLRNKVKQDGAE